VPQVHGKTQEDDFLDRQYSSKKILSILRADCGTRLHSGAIFFWLYGQRRIIVVLTYSGQTRISKLFGRIGHQFSIYAAA
jgi:hypothetical protein